MARTPTKPKPARKAQPRVTPAPRKAGSDADRDRRAFDFAVRRVPAWQVSVTSALLTLMEAESTPEQLAGRIKLVLDQVPDTVLAAAKLFRRGQWKRS